MQVVPFVKKNNFLSQRIMYGRGSEMQKVPKGREIDVVVRVVSLFFQDTNRLKQRYILFSVLLEQVDALSDTLVYIDKHAAVLKKWNLKVGQVKENEFISRNATCTLSQRNTTQNCLTFTPLRYDCPQYRNVTFHSVVRNTEKDLTTPFDNGGSKSQRQHNTFTYFRAQNQSEPGLIDGATKLYTPLAHLFFCKGQQSRLNYLLQWASSLFKLKT